MRIGWCNHHKNQWGISSFKWYLASSPWLSLSQKLPKTHKKTKKNDKIHTNAEHKEWQTTYCQKELTEFKKLMELGSEKQWWSTHTVLHDTEQIHPLKGRKFEHPCLTVWSLACWLTSKVHSPTLWLQYCQRLSSFCVYLETATSKIPWGRVKWGGRRR